MKKNLVSAIDRSAAFRATLKPGTRILSRSHLRGNPFPLSFAEGLDQTSPIFGSDRRKGFLLKLPRERVLGTGSAGLATK